MLFSSAIFLFVFLPLVLGTYFFVPKKYKNYHVLGSSIAFYYWGEKNLVLIMIATVLIDYFSAILIEKGKRSLGLGIALAYNLGLLFYFKYLNFTFDNIYLILEYLGLTNLPEIPSILMPLGISFLTFHSLSYVIDVYRGEIKANRNIIDFGTYIFLFPHLIAGPIVRYVHIENELRERTVTADKFAEGVKRFIIGLGKKMIIANNCAYVTDTIFKLPQDSISTILIWLAVLSYTLQIFYDFSGYSDMAIGLAKMLGFDFKENFNYPYISKSIKEFWRRWHISLSSWFRDYLYIPLGGARVSAFRNYMNLMIVFMATGFWHGANWNFIFLGLYHGFFIVAERIVFDKFLDKIAAPFAHFYTLMVLIIGWLFFRAENMGVAWEYFIKMFSYSTTDTEMAWCAILLSKEVILALVLGVILTIPIYGWCEQKIATIGARYSFVIPLVSYSYIVFLMALFVLSCAKIAVNTYNPFIYFRF